MSTKKYGPAPRVLAGVEILRELQRIIKALGRCLLSGAPCQAEAGAKSRRPSTTCSTIRCQVSKLADFPLICAALRSSSPQQSRTATPRHQGADVHPNAEGHPCAGPLWRLVTRRVLLSLLIRNNRTRMGRYAAVVYCKISKRSLNRFRHPSPASQHPMGGLNL